MPDFKPSFLSHFTLNGFKSRHIGFEMCKLVDQTDITIPSFCLIISLIHLLWFALKLEACLSWRDLSITERERERKSLSEERLAAIKAML